MKNPVKEKIGFDCICLMAGLGKDLVEANVFWLNFVFTHDAMHSWYFTKKAHV